MDQESPRRRVRRAKQSRPVAPGHAGLSPASVPGEAEPPPANGELPVRAPAEAAVAQPDVPLDFAVDEQEWEPDALPDSSRDGAWLPAGITVLVMVSLLVCAGLVLIAYRQ